MIRPALPVAALLAAFSLACGTPSQVRPAPAEPSAPSEPTVARAGGPTAPTEVPGGSAAARAGTAVGFEVTVFETADGAAPPERLIPADVGGRAQFWPGNAGDVLERQIGAITHILSGDAISSGWLISDTEALAKADQIALRVIAVEPLPDESVEPGKTGRFASAPVDGARLPTDGKWYRVRFFPGGAWKQAQLQGYLHLGQNSPRWYRVDGLIRGLYGPQTRDYQKGDLFELRATARPSGVKLYPLD